MVSELSARLLRGQMLGNNNEERSAVVMSDGEPMMTISACSEKLSQQAMPSKTSRRGTVRFADSHSVGFKRRKIDVLHFAASRVKQDLERGGLPFPALDASLRHHVLMDCSNYILNKSNHQKHARGIQRLCSKAVASSPFLTAAQGTSCSSRQATMGDLEKLFSVTYDAYSKPSCAGSSSSSSGGNASDLSSICSLTSETDSSIVNNNNNTNNGMAPLLEDALANQRNASAVVVSTPEIDAVYTNPISIRDAFENTCEPRLVTLSFAPFLVVHANPEYSRMTGLTPADILGKPLHEVIQDKACKQATAKTHSLASLNNQVTSFVTPAASGEDTKCRVHVSVVGTDTAAVKKDKRLVTHFMVSLTEERDTEEATAVADSAAPEHDDAANTNLMRVEPLPSMNSSNAGVRRQVHNMRLHCGVMG